MRPVDADMATVSLAGPEKARCGDAAGGVRGEGYVAVAAADGVGTRACDHAASETAVRSFLDALTVGTDRHDQAIVVAIQKASEQVHSKGGGACRGMRSTLVVALWTGGDRAWVSSVGDSRAYRLARGQVEAQLLTTDDAGLERVPPSLRHLERGQPLYREGLTQAVGQAGPLDVEVRETAFLPGESLVLATDGMWGAPRFRDVLASCAALDLQDALDRWGGLRRDDDATLTVLRRPCEPGDPASPAPVGVADAYAQAVSVWTALQGAVDQGRWPAVVELCALAVDRALPLGQRRLIGLADRIVRGRAPDRAAFDAVLSLARSSS